VTGRVLESFQGVISLEDNTFTAVDGIQAGQAKPAQQAVWVDSGSMILKNEYNSIRGFAVQ
jgi:hypothetical protein